MQTKKLLFALLGSFVLLPANVWSQEPYNRLNSSGFVFDGHRVEQVVVKPYQQSGPVTISHDESDDDKVVFLYHPKTGTFLYADGSWGTEAVGRHTAFGMPFKIVDPTGAEGLSSYCPQYNHDEVVGFGIYSESVNAGHYLARDHTYFVGSPTFYDNGDVTGTPMNRARFFVDRGGYAGGGYGADYMLKCDWQRAQGDNIFNWHFEGVDPYGDPDLHLYRLYTYMQNQGTDPGEHDDGYVFDEGTPLYKHYVKLEHITPYADQEGLGFYALTTARYNTNEHKNYIWDDETRDAVEGYPDRDDYIWQIVTRKDLKQKFLLDQEDPYNANVEIGNATFFIDNPDFSRPLYQTIQPNEYAYWEESDDGIYQFREDIYGFPEYGRFAFLHPNTNGYLRQTFIPNQFGLYRLDIQGYVFNLTANNATATMSLESQTPGVIYSDPVDIPKIDLQDAGPIFTKIGDMARKGIGDHTFWYSSHHHVDNSLTIFKYAENSENPETGVNGQQIKPGYSDVYFYGTTATAAGTASPQNYSASGLYRYRFIDRYGRVATGVYINGDPKSTLGSYNSSGSPELRYQIDTYAWRTTSDGNVEVKVDTKVTLAPYMIGNGNEGGDGAVRWLTPKSDNVTTRQLTIDKVKYDDAGDYICTYYDSSDAKWNVVRYTLKVIDPDNLQMDTPPVAQVKVNGNNPYDISTSAPTFTPEDVPVPSTDDFYYADQTAYQNGLAASDILNVERVVGQVGYNDIYKQKYVSSVYFYVPENAAENPELMVTLSFDGIGNPLKQLVALDNMRLTYLGDEPFIMDEDNDPAVRTHPSPLEVNARWIPTFMNRSFTEGAWNAFVCPIPLAYGQLKAAFGDDVEVSEIKEDEALANGDPYRIMFQSRIKSGENHENYEQVIRPGHFYLLKPSKLNTISDLSRFSFTRDAYGNIDGFGDAYIIQNKNFVFLGRHNLTPFDDNRYPNRPSELLSTENPDFPYDYSNVRLKGNVIDGLSANSPYRNFYWTFYYQGGADHNDIQLHGSYYPQVIEDRGLSYIFAYNKKTEETDLIHLNANASSGGPTSLDGFRFYIKDVDYDGDAKPLTFEVDGVSDEGETTDITNAIADPTFGNGDVYTITGQKVTGKLTKGIYVKNGKKFLVR